MAEISLFEVAISIAALAVRLIKGENIGKADPPGLDPLTPDWSPGTPLGMEG